MKNTHRGVLILVKLQAKLTLLHGCFSRFLNCTNATKSHNVSYFCKKLHNRYLTYWVFCIRFCCIIIKTALTALVFPTEYYGSGDWYIEHAHWVFFVPPSWNKTKLYLIMLYLTHFKKFPKNDFPTRRLLFYCKTIIRIHYFLKGYLC